MKNEFNYISNIGDEVFEEEIVLPFINEKGNPCILIKNSKEKTKGLRAFTDNLEFHLNSTIYKDEKKYYFHVISCMKNDDYSLDQFKIVYDYLFKSIKEPKSDYEINSLITSLEQLFKVSSEKDLKKLHIGVFGELLFILQMYENGANNILTKYHSNFFSKHDLEVDRYNRIEIKSTIGSKRIHHFSHDQLVRKDINVYVVSVVLEESTEGVSLNELFDMILKKADDPQITYWLGKLKGFCGISCYNPGPSFSINKAKQEIKIFKADNLPHLIIDETKGVTNISYDVDCSLIENLSIENFINIINKILN